jgi:hypothetical protein
MWLGAGGYKIPPYENSKRYNFHASWVPPSGPGMGFITKRKVQNVKYKIDEFF